MGEREKGCPHICAVYFMLSGNTKTSHSRMSLDHRLTLVDPWKWIVRQKSPFLDLFCHTFRPCFEEEEVSITVSFTRKRWTWTSPPELWTSGPKQRYNGRFSTLIDVPTMTRVFPYLPLCGACSWAWTQFLCNHWLASGMKTIFIYSATVSNWLTFTLRIFWLQLTLQWGVSSARFFRPCQWTLFLCTQRISGLSFHKESLI